MRLQYAYYRHSNFSRDAFVRRWRGHGALAMAQPEFFDPVTRYVHNDGLGEHAPPAGTHFFDALGEIHYASAADCLTSQMNDAAKNIVLPDGTIVFNRENGFLAAVDEDLVIAHTQAAALFKIFAFIYAQKPEDGAALTETMKGLDEAALRRADFPFADAAFASFNILDVFPLRRPLDAMFELSFQEINAGEKALAALKRAIDDQRAASGIPVNLIASMGRTCVLYDKSYL